METPLKKRKKENKIGKNKNSPVFIERKAFIGKNCKARPKEEKNGELLFFLFCFYKSFTFWVKHTTSTF